MVIDDLIPCEPLQRWEEDATPVFSKPQGNELWVLLLEKAFAKFVGSYGDLDGGQTSWAWQALTGVEEQVWYARGPDGVWTKHVVNPERQREMMRTDRRACPFFPADEGTLSDAGVFDLVHRWDRECYVMSAMISPSASEVEHERDDGLVEGHAYSLICVAEAGGQRLLQLRNPWGQHEWNGAWSDASPEWAQHPGVADAVGFSQEPDGLFWMALQDFVRVFGTVRGSPSGVDHRGGFRKTKLKPRPGCALRPSRCGRRCCSRARPRRKRRSSRRPPRRCSASRGTAARRRRRS